MAETPALPYISSFEALEWLTTSLEPKRPKPAPQAIFVLGSGSLHPVSNAAEYFNGLIRGEETPIPICFTSAGGRFGNNIVSGQPEVVSYGLILGMKGVPSKAIHYPVPSKWTTNTLMEAQAAIPFMTKGLGSKPLCVALFARSVHMRRAYATFCKQNPGVDFICHPDEERCTVELLPRLVDEVDRLREYGAKGDLVMQDIPDHVARIVEELRTHLNMPIPTAILEVIHQERRRLGMAPHHLNKQ